VAADGTVADTDGNNSPPAERVPAVAYVHGIDITVTGNYAAISSYIHALETQQWRFLWRRLELDASKYPEVSAHIEVATLGLERQWLTI
jgi:MSHA biogenesis protein MshJ